MRARYLLSAAAGALVAGALAGGVAWGGIPDADGVINGCYQKNQGQLRMIDPATDGCRPSEFPIAWTEQGATGDKGDRGAPGRDGADGHDGTGVTVENEPPGGANCPTGGRKLTDAGNGVVYVCDAPPPDPGEDD